MTDSDVNMQIRAVLPLLGSEPGLVQVAVEEGIVYLDGIAPSRNQRGQIEATLGRLPGVRRIVNCLVVEHIARLPTARAACPRPNRIVALLQAILAGVAAPGATPRRPHPARLRR